MPCCNTDRPQGNYIRNPYTGAFEKIEAPIVKNLDFRILDDKRCCEDGRPQSGIDVHVCGLETYDQVKDLIEFVHKLWKGE